MTHENKYRVIHCQGNHYILTPVYIDTRMSHAIQKGEKNIHTKKHNLVKKKIK